MILFLYSWINYHNPTNGLNECLWVFFFLSNGFLGRKEWERRVMLQRAASNAYSWWWASHIRTKQSKWLEQNLHGMYVYICVHVCVYSTHICMFYQYKLVLRFLAICDWGIFFYPDFPLMIWYQKQNVTFLLKFP